MARRPCRLFAIALTGMFLGLLLAQFPLLQPAHSDTAIVTIANDSANGASSLATEGGQKLIEDSFGRIIAVYVDASGRLAVTYANSNPSLAGSWATPTKSPDPDSPYSKPAAVLANSTSLRIIVQGGTGPLEINDQLVTIQRDVSQNIVGVSFGNSTQLDGSGKARHPAATIAHNGDILAAWNWESGNSSLVKTLRWRAGTGWTSFNGLSALPDDAIIGDSIDDCEIFPSIIQRRDNHHVYLIGNREESHPSTTLVFNKATFDGSNWSWGTQNLNYESNAARGVSDSTSLTWDPVRNLVVVAYDVSDTTIYGVFRLDALDQKEYIFTPSLMMTNNEWGSIEVDETTGDYYLFTMNTSIGRNHGMLGYTKRVGGVWNASLTILDANTNNVAISVKRIGSSTSIDLLYTRTVTDSVSQLRFVRISTGLLPSTRPSDVTISAQPNPSNDTESIAISGMLTDGLNGTGLPGRTVIIEQSLDQSNWLLLSQTTTVADGYYQASVTFPPGTYYFRAIFPGEIAYSSSASVPYQQIVQSEFPKSYAIVGDEDGRVYRLLDGAGGGLELIGQPTTSPLRRVAWRPGGSYALIVGQAATLLKYDGNQFTPIATGLPSSANLLSAAWKPDGSYALIAGSSGTVLKYNGSSVNVVSSPATVSIRSISWRPNGSSALLVGDGGTMLVYENDFLTSFASGTSSDLHAAAWNPSGQYALVAGANGTILRHNGVSNTAINTTGIYQSSHVVLAIGWNSSGNVALLPGQTGLVLTYDGAILSRLPTLTSANLYSLGWSAWWASIVGGQGTVLKFSGSTLKQVSSGVTSSLRAIEWTEPAAGLDNRPPSQPQNLAAAAAGVSRIDLSWTASNDNVAVWGYDVFRNGDKVATVAGALASFSDTLVVLSNTYTYYVVAFDAEENRSPPSESLSVMILFFNPTDDATIKQAEPRNNYGLLTLLEADNSPVDHFLIKFNVTGITAGQVTSARIRLYNENGSPKGGNFYTTASASWTEISVTWNSAPANQTLVASLGQVSPGNWYEVDITSIVTDNGVVSLRVSSTSSDGADYSSRQGANSPELLVTVVNKPPQLASVGNKAAAEETLLSFNTTATDPDNDALTFSLDPGAPAGASLTPGGVFSWTPSETQGPGTYQVTVTVSDGVLTDSETITITASEVNKAPVLSPIGDRTFDEGDTLSFIVTATDPDTPSNTVTLSMSGNVPGATFNAATGAFTWTLGESQGPGIFVATFTATDNGSPTFSDNETMTITVNEVNQPPSLTVPGGQAVNEGSTVTFTVSAADPDIPANSITLSASGIPSGASFNPSTGSFSWTPALGQRGTYTVTFTATDNGAPSYSNAENVTITVSPATLQASFSFNPGTAGKPTGFNGTASGGTPPYSFAWSFGDGSSGSGATASHSYSVKGSYNVTLTVTDSGNATTAVSQLVTVSPQPLVVAIVSSSATAGKPVNFTTVANGGTTPYIMSWSFGDDLSGTGNPVFHTYPVKGSYTVSVTVTDANNASASASTILSVEPQPLSTSIATSAPASVGSPVSFNSTATGGTTPCSFAWNFGDGSTGSGGSTMHTYSVKGEHAVVVSVTDANGASASAAMALNVDPLPLAASFTTSPATAGKPASFDATASGGTAPYSFSWAFGDGTGDSGSLVAHSYPVKGSYNATLTVTDANGANASTSVAVTVAPQTLTLTTSCSDSTAGKPVSCSSSASGGTAPYAFAWAFSDGGTGSGPSVSHTFTVKGTYSVAVNVTDANLVSASASFQVIVSPQALQVEFVFTPSSPTVGKPANFSAAASGGTAPYTFRWNFGDGAVASGSLVVHSYAVKGPYTVTLNATDANGSMAIVARVLAVSPQPLVASITSSPATAGKPVDLTATVSGGTGPYAVSWSFGDASSGTSTPVSHIYTVKGTYNVTVTVTDANNATASDSGVLEVSAQPLTAIISVGNATAGKPTSISITVSGGTAPYTVSWDFGDSSVGIGDTVSHVYNVKGSYAVAANVTDVNSASVMASTIVTVTPQPLVVTASCGPATAGKPATCNATASGGTSPYLVSWDVGKDGSIDGEGETFTTLFPVKGTYSLDSIVRDANNATARVNLLVAVEPQPITASIISSTATTGKPADFNAVISGGTGPYSVQWTFGNGTNATGNPVSHTYPVKGSYNVTVSLTDANGKSANSTAAVIVSPQPLTVTAQCSNGTAGKPISCNAAASGGTSPYTFSWSFSDNTAATGSDLSHTFAVKGSYTATVTASDVNAAVANSTIAVSIAPQPFLADFTMNAGTVSVGEDLVLAATASGGTLPYLFSWDFGDGLTASGGSVAHAYSVKGSYTINLTATDVNGAAATAAKAVTVLPLPLVISGVNIVPAQPSVGDPATFTATMTGGTAPYVVVWDLTGDNVSDAQDNPVGWVYSAAQNVTISVYARDANNATSTVVSTTITVVPFPISEFEFDWADYDNSGKVDIVDVAFAADCFDLTSSSPAWLSCAYWDFDLDGRIGIVDIAMVADQFDRTVTSPFPGEGQAAGVMDPQWHEFCYLLAPIDRAYCESRLG